ncbi:class I SAM-dependent methyltransferase [Dyella solisilvae]|uniref:Class I SAM-dependent methyltransferase n=1 Tax=Dyella solisilvae TaxID=1920168 RepID=A0A370K8H4_9GAMM|nr:class I SAM-dependent methyltransferase [Dyella solisilvae]RDI98727.1 class I SAM-dependent methyltransferase [Dyella solisilvae]
MNRFWHRYLKPLIDTAQPHQLIEIGADRGWNTRNILTYCRQTGARADIIDPAPQASLHQVLADFGPAEYRYHPLKSVAAIPQLDTPDLALIDGDHNWATVYSELTLLQARAEQQNLPPPIVLGHDVAWPYARRDMYYNPDDLDASQKHAHAYMGMLPGVNELVEQGMNGVLANALHEGGPRNGVLTAYEDYIESSGIDYTFRKLPFFNGLGILVPAARMTPRLQALIDSFFTAESLQEACMAIEADSMHLRAILTQTESCLTRRTAALERAREAIDLQRQRILELERLLAARASTPA